MKRIVADTGPLLHLHEAASLHLLPLIGAVKVPGRVLAELTKHAPGRWSAPLPDWLNTATLSGGAQERATGWQQSDLLHTGEAAALALADELKPDWFLTDDAAARLLAESLGIETHGSLGVVLWCAAQHLIVRSEAETCLGRLEQSSLWLSPRVRTTARAALARLYKS